MEILLDPSIWIGLLTLVILEIVLGIDNLVFIAILADKLPSKQRDKARVLGLFSSGNAFAAACAHLLVSHLNSTTFFTWNFHLFRP